MKNRLTNPIKTDIDPVLLWLLVHGGDPGPDDVGGPGGHQPGPPKPPISQLTTALTIYQLASRLTDAATRADIQKLAAAAVASLSQELVG